MAEIWRAILNFGLVLSGLLASIYRRKGRYFCNFLPFGRVLLVE
jgi:hypothetical protein